MHDFFPPKEILTFSITNPFSRNKGISQGMLGVKDYRASHSQSDDAHIRDFTSILRSAVVDRKHNDGTISMYPTTFNPQQNLSL